MTEDTAPGALAHAPARIRNATLSGRNTQHVTITLDGRQVTGDRTKIEAISALAREAVATAQPIAVAVAIGSSWTYLSIDAEGQVAAAAPPVTARTAPAAPVDLGRSPDDIFNTGAWVETAILDAAAQPAPAPVQRRASLWRRRK